MALRTDIPLTYSDIDTSWCFKYYLNLPFELTGADHKIKSPFTIDKDPSFSIYKSKSKYDSSYRFNDLSSGVKGDVIDLVAILKAKNGDFNTPLSRKEAFEIIKKDFESFHNGKEYTPTVQLLNSKGRIVDWELRNWKDSDYKWWNMFEITPPTLERFNTAPMGGFKMHKITNGEEKTMEFNNPSAFAYLTKKGELARIYQPGMGGAKFIKVLDTDWLQGYDQLKFNTEDLLIMSSLKDGMCFTELEIPGYEFLAPDSENVMIKKPVLDFLKTKYKRVRTLFDIDAPGIKAAKKYNVTHGLEDVYLNLSKDVADSAKDFGKFRTRVELIKIL